ncbi:MAG TPA: phenylalanine--tRNA ligase subunit beta [Candidatus Agrococcus pullicola]|uniref:Phenylalanine--tRNA ligase beta subunit n=1 Tax=Candidatus Agrococcus pullicola TaxID=2838429 RepID=A0A9D1YRY1_9MICO|nr:phenylalanine--tRNA ligase subunit beta [Candidatus Agrococcus pullicola]
MRVPLDWLGDYVALPDDVTPEGVLEALVSVGLEDEAIHRTEISGPLTVGRVLSFDDEPQKNGKTIRWVQVDVGEETPRGIVCGASNFAIDDLVAVALPGTVLPGGFEISARKTYGHISDGMMASASELGIGDDHDGILRLQELGLSAEPGDDARSLLGLDGVAIEVAVTTDRGYALSLRGIAREYANATGAKFSDPALIETGAGEGFPLALEDDAPIRGRVGCARFIARAVRGIDVNAPTPRWMAQRLALAGMRPISIAVDITNYVMLELGQPLHAYDLERLTGGITVRRARQGETIVTLDDTERKLDPEDLLITDDSGAVGIAGVMGGASTEVTDATNDVLIEAAWFDPVTIGRSARRHRLHSEASKRFARGVDTALQEAAAERAVQLLVELAGGTADSFGATVEQDVPSVDTIALRRGKAARVMGIGYTDDEQRDALRAIGADVQDTEDGWSVRPPTWRPDLVDEIHLVEEIGRIVGFDRIGSELPVPPPGRGYTRAQKTARDTANALAAAGATEVLVSPFVSEQQIGMTGESAVELTNALDAERRWLRTALVPGLVETLARNVARGLVDVAVFELGTVFVSQGEHGTAELPSAASRPDDATLASLDNLPLQDRHVAVALTGNRVRKQPGLVAEHYDLADALDFARVAAAAAGLEIEVRQGSRDWTHPGRTADILVAGETIGYAAELLPSVAKEHSLESVVVAELNFERLVALRRTTLEPAVIAGVPAATQDLSLTVQQDVPAGEVLRTVAEGAGALLEDIRLVDDYRGAGLADGEKSLTFALRFRAPDRTLKAEEASEAKMAGVASAEEKFGAKLRA